MEDNSLEDTATVALVNSAHLSQLESLSLSWNEIGNETAKALGQSAVMKNLKVLDLERNYITEEGMAGLCGGALSQLEELNLSSNKLGDAGAVALAQAEYDRTKPLVEQGAVAVAVGDRAETDLNRARARAKAAEEAIRVAELGGREAARGAAEAAADAAGAAREQAAWQLEQRSVTARRAGRIEMLVGRPGEFANAGQTVMAILPDDALKVRFFAPVEAVQTIAVGDTALLSAESGGQAVSATITFIAAEPEFTPPVIYSRDVRDKLVFAIEARLPSGADLRPGLPVDVSLP